MSVYLSTAAWKAKIDNPTRKLVLLSLADQANDEGWTWPAMRTIAQRCGVAERTVREHIAMLEVHGILKREQRHDASGRQTSNLFQISIEELGRRSHTAAPPAETGGGGATPQGGGGATPQGGGGATPPPLNHQYEPTERTQKAAAADSDFFSEEKEKLSKPAIPIEDARLVWNREVIGLRKVTSINGKRETLFRARWAELGSLEAWTAFCKRIEASDFLTGRKRGTDGKKWTADFDWCILPSNFTKITEGKYDPKPETTNGYKFWQ
jgi:hypothetical protein